MHGSRGNKQALLLRGSRLFLKTTLWNNVPANPGLHECCLLTGVNHLQWAFLTKRRPLLQQRGLFFKTCLHKKLRVIKCSLGCAALSFMLPSPDKQDLLAILVEHTLTACTFYGLHTLTGNFLA